MNTGFTEDRRRNFCPIKARNVGIAGARARLLNADRAKKGKSRPVIIGVHNV